MWCKSKKWVEEIRSFELSGKEIFSNCHETKSKEVKEKRNGHKTSAYRGQSVRYKSWWKQGNIKLAVSEEHAVGKNKRTVGRLKGQSIHEFMNS